MANDAENGGVVGWLAFLSDGEVAGTATVKGLETFRRNDPVGPTCNIPILNPLYRTRQNLTDPIRGYDLR